MEVRSLGQSIQYRELKAGKLFFYRVGEEAALGFQLARNQFGMGAVAFTHAPAEGQLPSLVTDRFFEGDTTVFEYETPSISAEQEFAKMQLGRWPEGVFISRTDGHFLSCTRQGQSYNLNWSTGEIDQTSHRPAYWTPHWKISDRFGNAIFFSARSDVGEGRN
jgi:hypothetical protein